MRTWCVGDRVYYKENGATDTGTVSMWDSSSHYYVEWDNGTESDWYTAEQLARVPGQR